MTFNFKICSGLNSIRRGYRVLTVSPLSVSLLLVGLKVGPEEIGNSPRVRTQLEDENRSLINSPAMAFFCYIYISHSIVKIFVQ